MAVTKAYEKEALEKIRKIVAELGDDSYVGMALEGCLEDAESNIENDFGNSMKKRFERTLDDLNECKKQLRDERLTNRKLLEKSEEADEGVLSSDDFELCVKIASSAIQMSSRMANEYGKQIIEYAEHPESPEFLDAVKYNRSLDKLNKDALDLANRLEYYRGKTK